MPKIVEYEDRKLNVSTFYLHEWQIEIMNSLAKELMVKPSTIFQMIMESYIEQRTASC